jgi:hypothetical protein
MIPWRPIVVISLGGSLLLAIGREAIETVGIFSAAPVVAIVPIGTTLDAGSAPASEPPTAAETGTILSRPLFNWNRQPSRSVGNPDGPLPRLSGIIIGAAGRYAIFAAQPGSKPQTIPEGGLIGRFTIDAITADHIILKSGAGEQNLHTSFGATPPPPMATPDAS